LWKNDFLALSMRFLRGRSSAGMDLTEMQTKIVALPLICLLCSFLAPACWSQEKPAMFEVGALFTYLHVPESSPINAQNQGEFGGRFSWNFVRYVSLDVEIDSSPFRTTNLETAYQGGYLSQAFVGLKSGKRWNRFGVFGKFRPGVNSYSGAITQSSQTVSLTFGRRTDPCFDVGGVLEFYVSRRILIRYDFGDTIIHYNASSITITGSQPIAVPGEVRNNFQFSTAIAFRF
jgi:hypothetical protein